MNIALNSFANQTTFASKQHSAVTPQNIEQDLKNILQPFTENKKAKIPSYSLTKGINPNNNDVFDTFTKLDDITREINFVRTPQEWTNCLMEELDEFLIARDEYNVNPSVQNYDHMEEEMGDIFYTAASIAKDSQINPKEAFKSTNRKFFNRINIMERLFEARKGRVYKADSLAQCSDTERRSLWNTAKRKIYDAQALQYNVQA